MKEFVFGTSFLSVSLKDQDSSEAAPSSPLSVSLCLTLLSLFPLYAFAVYVLFFGPASVSVCAFFSSRDSLAIFLCPASLLTDNRPGPPQNLKGSMAPRVAEPPVHAPCLPWPDQGSSLDLCFPLYKLVGSNAMNLKTEVVSPREELVGLYLPLLNEVPRGRCPALSSTTLYRLIPLSRE